MLVTIPRQSIQTKKTITHQHILPQPIPDQAQPPHTLSNSHKSQYVTTSHPSHLSSPCNSNSKLPIHHPEPLASIGTAAQKQMINSFTTWLLSLLASISMALIASLPATISAMIPQSIAWRPSLIDSPSMTKDLAVCHVETRLQAWISEQRWSPGWVVVALITILIGLLVLYLTNQRRQVTEPRGSVNTPSGPAAVLTFDEASIEAEDEDPTIAHHRRTRTTRNSITQRPTTNLFPQFVDDDTASEYSETASITSDDSQDSNTTIHPHQLQHCNCSQQLRPHRSFHR